MKIFRKSALAGAVALAVAQSVSAGTAPFFVPLTSGEIVEPADSVDERNAPWTAPAGVTQTNLMSMETVETTVGSVVRVGAAHQSSMFDMLAYDTSGRYIYIPHETPLGAGVSRVDTETLDDNGNALTEILFRGDQTGAPGFLADTDFGAFDPVRFTPNNSLIAGEEWAGLGRLVEICDPFGEAPADPVAGGSELVAGNCESDEDADWRVLDNLPLSAHEGLSFSLDAPDEIMYFVDEDRSGSIYKVEFTNPGEYNEGAVTSVLVVDAYEGDPASRWDRDANPASIREGQATWVPLTDATGAPLEGLPDLREPAMVNGVVDIDQGDNTRAAADAVNGTPYGRPEDSTISKLPNGNEILYVAVTSENSVISIEETGNGPFVRYFASPETPINLGFAPTNATLGAPDNLTIDSLGNIYIIEDSPNTTTVGANGGDIWFARDTNNDGVAESIDHFLSLQVNQSEATGMIFDPVDPTKFVVAVQHPASTALGDADNDGIRDTDVGFGDAIWEFDLTNVAPPECGRNRRDFMTFNRETRRWVRACSTQRDFNAIDQMVRSEEEGDFPNP